MSSRLLTRIEIGLAAALLLAAPLALSADKRKELYDRAVTAGSLNQVEEAARLFCEVAKLDPKYLDSAQNCTIMQQEAERERKRGDERFAEGLKAFQDGRFDDAEQKFKNVRAGSHLEEARQYLAKIPAARQQKASADAENTKFEHALQAYKANDFASAKTGFGQITGKRSAEAQVLLDNIKRYEQAMVAGDAAASDPAKAVVSYNQAAAIKPDGPGDPRAKIAQMQSKISAASQAAPAPAAPPPAAVTRTASPAVGAVKEVRAVDVAKLLREASAAQARGDLNSASGKFLAVLAADPANAIARRGLDVIAAQNPGRRISAGSEADIMLSRAIREFYTGYTDDAEVHIRDYLNANGAKTALSHFYLGAIKLTRYYLGGERDSDKKLLSDAKIAFRLARGTAGFTPPSQKVISPKILKVYEDSSQ